MDEIAAGIVLYNPNINRLKENISSVIVQCQKIYLVDNGSRNVDAVKELLKIFNQEKIHLYCNLGNEGIAKALNQLCGMAMDEGFEWILTMDQDSVSSANMIEDYCRYTNWESAGMFCPIIYDRNKGGKVKQKEEDILEIDECITSGSMLRLDAWGKIGGFDESMFIDGVDFDLCHRLTKAGYKIYCVTSVILLHELGKIEIRNFLVWKVIVKNHSSFRKYYIARNTVYLAKKEHTSLTKALLQNVKLTLICLGYEDKKFEKVKRIFRGTYDGIIQQVMR